MKINCKFAGIFSCSGPKGEYYGAVTGRIPLTTYNWGVSGT